MLEDLGTSVRFLFEEIVDTGQLNFPGPDVSTTNAGPTALVLACAQGHGIILRKLLGTGVRRKKKKKTLGARSSAHDGSCCDLLQKA